MKYDVAIIGAGIAGCSCAYFLKKSGLRVLLIDKNGIASGGSGAAGAFISPKIEKHGELNRLSQEAYQFSIDFYRTNFPQYITISKLIHIMDNKKIILDESGLVNSKKVCEALAEGIDFMVKDLKAINEVDAHKVVITTGADKTIFPKKYLNIRAIFGHRVDIKTTTPIKNHYHEDVSISKSINGHSSIGATHNVHMKVEMLKDYDYTKGHKELLEKASKTVHLQDVTIMKEYIGFRAGSNDYMPHLGRFVDDKTTIEKFPQMKHGRYYKDLIFHENIYTLNGVGGYGFVLAPYLAKILTENISEGIAIPKELSIERFFRRWVKKCS